MMKSLNFFGLALFLAPLYAGMIFKIKAFFGGRKGSPVLINYYTLIKLLKKGSVYSTSTTWIFKLGPMVSLAAANSGSHVFAGSRSRTAVFVLR